MSDEELDAIEEQYLNGEHTLVVMTLVDEVRELRQRLAEMEVDDHEPSRAEVYEHLKAQAEARKQ